MTQSVQHYIWPHDMNMMDATLNLTDGSQSKVHKVAETRIGTWEGGGGGTHLDILGSLLALIAVLCNSRQLLTLHQPLY